MGTPLGCSGQDGREGDWEGEAGQSPVGRVREEGHLHRQLWESGQPFPQG